MDNQQQIKAHLALLSVYLMTPIPDAVLLLYAADLGDLSPGQLQQAIAALKADEGLWTGKFPLPAKIRAYLTGSVDEQALGSTRRIMAFNGREPELTQLEKQVATDYGWRTLADRHTSNTPTIMSQLRELFRAAYAQERREARLELPNHSLEALAPLASPAARVGAPPEDPDLQGRQGEGSHLEGED